jgi:hypothetical protein
VWRLGYRPHLSDPRRPRLFALVLVDRQWPDDALGRVATLEEAKAQFQKSWDAWKAWAKLERGRNSSIRDENIFLTYFLNHIPLNCSSHSLGYQADHI